MRIKIIGDNNCARATRHLLRLAGFAVTEYLPADAVVGGPLAGYAITIDLAPAQFTPDSSTRPDSPTHDHASAMEEAARLSRDASSPAFVLPMAGRTTAGLPAAAASIHFDSVDSALEAAVLRHVAELAAAPVVVDRPGGVVHSDRELRIVAPNTGDEKADEAGALAIEFGVLRGLLDLTAPVADKKGREAGGSKRALRADAAEDSGEFARSSPGIARKKWWPFGILLLACLCSAGILPAMWGPAGAERIASTSRIEAKGAMGLPARAGFRGVEGSAKIHRLKPVPLKPILLEPVLLEPASLATLMETHGLKSVPLNAALLGAEAQPQGQFATGQGFKITDGNNFFVVDPCKGQVKFYASINQTGNTQIVAGTGSKKIYVCSIHVVTAAAANVAVVEGTGSVCATGTAGVSGFGGATAATGWNFAANGGIALGNGDSSLGAEANSGDNLCIFNSGSGQISGGISYVVQ